MTDKNAPLTADETTGLRVAGFEVVHRDQLHQDAHRLDAAEHRSRDLLEVLGEVREEVASAHQALRSASADQALAALTVLLERLDDELDAEEVEQ